MQKEKHSEIWETYSDSWSEPNESFVKVFYKKYFSRIAVTPMLT
jgi:hypothetical protein